MDGHSAESCSPSAKILEVNFSPFLFCLFSLLPLLLLRSVFSISVITASYFVSYFFLLGYCLCNTIFSIIFSFLSCEDVKEFLFLASLSMLSLRRALFFSLTSCHQASSLTFACFIFRVLSGESVFSTTLSFILFFLVACCLPVVRLLFACCSSVCRSSALIALVDKIPVDPRF